MRVAVVYAYRDAFQSYNRFGRCYTDIERELPSESEIEEIEKQIRKDYKICGGICNVSIVNIFPVRE